KGGDKESRGRVLSVAGSPEIPGAAVLAGMAALRAGAGKLVIATVSSMATAVALAVPEARVVALPETHEGGIAPPGIAELIHLAQSAQAVLLGPGLQDEYATCAMVRGVLPQIGDAQVLLDAFAMGVVCAHAV